MTENLFVDCERSLTEADLDEVELRFDFRFPDEFRRHYLQYNGGSPTRYRFDTGDGRVIVAQFYPIKYGRPHGTLETGVQWHKVERPWVPEHLVPFGADPGGDYICFSIDPSDFGSIWILRGDNIDDPERFAVRLADSLPDFLDGMVES